MDSPKTNPPSTSNTQLNEHSLWISDKWFIPVNDLGECVGPCLEGALGFVVQLWSTDGEGRQRRMALKIPRLMGETHRENAYISDLMEKELRAVQEIFENPDANSKGLLHSQLWERGGPLRGQINTSKGLPDAVKWHEAIVLVHFEKGRRPRFCLVKKPSLEDLPDDGKNGREKPLVFPESIPDCPINEISIYDQLQKEAFNPKDKRQWDHTVFIDLGKDNQNKPLIINKEAALKQSPTGVTWFTCVPSVPYEWAPGTLQEAISLNKRGDWGIREHFSLARRICMAICALHRQEMIHADLRPANVCYRGNPTTPDSYYVSDYGSFAEMGVRETDHSPTGETVLGPVAGTERVSPFYAPERRGGLEREAADTAIIRKNPGGATLEIILGWESSLQGNYVRPPITDPKPQDIAKEIQAQTPPPLSGNSLLKGDRIQIRDYVFDVIDASESDGQQRITCRAQSWKIFQGRIVVQNTDTPFDKEQRLPIPRTIELQQWSAATDLFSLGALFLYSVYRSSSPQLSEPSATTEEKFREMLAHFEGEPYFKHIWPEIESLRAQLEEHLIKDKDSSASQFGELPFRKKSKEGIETPNTLKAETMNVVLRITQTVPWSRRLVEVFDFNLGSFIFFIHFVLCCLHRRSHLTEDTGQLGTKDGPTKTELAESEPDKAGPDLNQDSGHEKPFCENRREPPTKTGGASRALDRLDLIRTTLIGDKRLDAFKVDKNAIPKYDPRPDPLIRTAYYGLSEDTNRIAQLALEKLDDTGPIVKQLMSISGMSINELREPFYKLQHAISKSRRTDLLSKEPNQNDYEPPA